VKAGFTLGSPHSDLLVRQGSDTLQLNVEAMLAPGVPQPMRLTGSGSSWWVIRDVR